MSNITTERIRNLAVVAHGGAGKTSLVEAILYDSGMIERPGSVVEGNTVTDFEPEEIERKISISSSVAYCNWRGYRINIIDTPGYINFIEDTRGCLSVVDGTIVIVSAISGVKAETDKIWQFACEYELPRLVFINKMDRENASFERAIGELEKSYNSQPIPLSIPMGSGDSFTGIIDILNMKAIRYTDNTPSEMDIPDEFMEMAEGYRNRLIEKIAESDDALLERYLEGGDLTIEEIKKGIRESSITRRFIPVLCGSATKNIGVYELLDAVLLCLPSPVERTTIRPIKGKDPKTGKEITRRPLEDEPLSSRVFKTISDPFAGRLTIFRVFSGVLKADSTVYNPVSDSKEKIGSLFYLLGKKQEPVQRVVAGEVAAVTKLKETRTGDTLTDIDNPIIFEPLRFSEPMMSYAIEPKTRNDEEKVSSGLHKLLDEDPTLRFHKDNETKEMILSGMGQVHLEVTLQKLKRKFGAEVIMKTPKIPYRETIRVASSAQGKYKKQSGGRGQYGDCWIKIEPLPRGSGFEFVDNIVGGVIPRQYIPAVEKGIVEAMQEGVVAGYPMVDIRATVYDGSYHSVDSSEMAFKIAGSMAFKKAAENAKAVLLEPIVRLEVIVPDESLGGVLGDLSVRRGRVQGVEPQAGGNQKIVAHVPMAEVLTYANHLNSLTSGRGMYTLEYSHYEEVPSHLAQKIIAEGVETRKKHE